jgi:hypothetical protein
VAVGRSHSPDLENSEMTATTAQQLATLISALAQLAWPLVVVFLLLRYGDDFRALLRGRKLTKAGFGAASFEFGEVAKSVEVASAEAGIEESATERALIEQLARASPGVAIDTAWARVREASAIALARFGEESISPSTVGKLRQLNAHGLIEPELVDLGRTLKTMQTALLAQPNVEPPTDFATTFSVAAIALAKKISDILPAGESEPSYEWSWSYGSGPGDAPWSPGVTPPQYGGEWMYGFQSPPPYGQSSYGPPSRPTDPPTESPTD